MDKKYNKKKSDINKSHNEQEDKLGLLLNDLNLKENKFQNNFDDVHDVILEDKPRLKMILSEFRKEHWDQISDYEKWEKIQKLSDYHIDILDIKNKPQVEKICLFMLNPNQELRGSYDIKNNTVQINELWINDNKKVIDVVAHEIRHAYQNYRASQTEKKYIDFVFKQGIEDACLASNQPSRDYNGYRNLFVERDAREYAERSLNILDELEEA